MVEKPAKPEKRVSKVNCLAKSARVNPDDLFYTAQIS
jgi:hypothetical protein